MIKMEGGTRVLKRYRPVSAMAFQFAVIWVCFHNPFMNGYRIKGQSSTEAEDIYNSALALEQAGIQLLVLECIPHN